MPNISFSLRPIYTLPSLQCEYTGRNNECRSFQMRENLRMMEKCELNSIWKEITSESEYILKDTYKAYTLEC